MNALSKKLPIDSTIGSGKRLDVPFFIQIIQNCVKYNIDTNLIKRLHLYDLECLIVQFQIKEVKEYLAMQSKEKGTSNNVKNVTGNDALAMLRGGCNG